MRELGCGGIAVWGKSGIMCTERKFKGMTVGVGMCSNHDNLPAWTPWVRVSVDKTAKPSICQEPPNLLPENERSIINYVQ